MLLTITPNKRFLEINAEIIGLLARKIPACRFTAPLEEIDRTIG